MRRLFLFMGVFLLCFLCVKVVQAEEPGETDGLGEEELREMQRQTENNILKEFDFSEVDENLRKLFPEQKIQFSDVLGAMTDGDLEEAGTLFGSYLRDQFDYEFRTNRKNLIYMLLIAVIAAVFTNFSSAFQNKQVSEISFYVLYMLLITMCLTSFRIAMEGLEGRLEQLLELMQVLCPGYFLAVTIASGSSSSFAFYNLVLFFIYLVEVLVLKFLLPLINVYIMIQVMNYLAGEDLLSELADLIRKGVLWILKMLLGCVIGLNVIQGMLSPAIDTLKRSTITKTVEAIPALGNMFGSVTDVVLGTAVLIKNGIGMAGAILLLLASMIPVVQMMVLALFYKLAAALVQPVSDKRITGCIRSVSEGYALMLRVLSTTVILFLITIAVIAASTS